MNKNNVAGGSSGSTSPTAVNTSEAELPSEPILAYECRMPDCNRSFASSRGRGLHEQKQHKSWYDERQVENIVNRKAPWSAEEAALLARQEAHLTLKGERSINQALLPYSANRTLEAIKGQRKYKKHKDKVLQLVSEMQQGLEPLHVPVDAIDHQSSEASSNLVNSISELFGALEPLSGNKFHADKLDNICRNLKKWSTARIFEETNIYLLDVFPPPPEKQIKTTKTATKRSLTRRQARRAEYALTQKAWTRNPCNCLRTILKDKTTSQTPEKDIMVPFWQNIMTSERVATPGVGIKRPTLDALWGPICPAEVRSALSEITTAPGPDGVTARQLRAVPLGILTRTFNLFLVCGLIPKRLLESRTTLIPKKDAAQDPGDFRPITFSSVITRTFHKILATRLTKGVSLDKRQKAFLPVDGCAENIFKLDMVLRYHRQYFKPLYLASVDIAKAFDSVTHDTISDTLEEMGLPASMREYIMYSYKNSYTKLSCDGWQSDLIHPTCGVKQGDPLSPIIFNMVIDRLLRQMPSEIGVEVAGERINALAFADDLLLTASTPQGLQQLLDLTADFLAKCGLAINVSKSFTVALRNVPHKKMSVVDTKTKFSCLGRQLPSTSREDEWKYLGVPFTPEGRSLCQPELQLKHSIEKLTKAALKPQQRLFALRVVVLPGLYHLLVLGNTNLSRLKKIDTLVRGAVRKWLALPHDSPNAYVHASAKDGGLSIPSMRWLMPFRRKGRLESLRERSVTPCPFLAQEICIAERRLREGQNAIKTSFDLEKRWARLLHSSSDGIALKDSRRVPQQHQWITDGNRFLSGKDFVNTTKLRINALPNKSRSSRGRRSDRLCRAGCNEIETLNHILQRCHRTHSARVKRHNAIVAYIRRALEKSCEKVEEEPHFQTAEGLRKPDLVAKRGETAMVIDAQIVSEQADLTRAHERKIEYYKELEGAIKDRYKTKEVKFTSATISCRGIWDKNSVGDLTEWNIIKKKEIKILSTRALIGGINAYTIFNKTTTFTRRRTGIG